MLPMDQIWIWKLIENSAPKRYLMLSSYTPVSHGSHREERRLPSLESPVIGTIPSIPIPIPFANFGIELTPISNSSLGIGATTPTPIRRNQGGFQGIPMFVLKSVEKVEKRCEPGVTRFFLDC